MKSSRHVSDLNARAVAEPARSARSRRRYRRGQKVGLSIEIVLVVDRNMLLDLTGGLAVLSRGSQGVKEGTRQREWTVDQHAQGG
eukprot:763695-Hanusia_phi.AAC.1